MAEYIVSILISIMIFGVLALSLDLLIGYTGLFSIAQAALFGAGAYASALAAQHLGIGFWGGIGAAMVFGALISTLVAIPSLRVSGDYLVLASFGVQVVLSGLFLNLDDLTGGSGGLRAIPRPEILGHRISGGGEYFALYGAIALAVFLALRHITRSPFGLLLQAVREDEVMLQALGKNVVAIKVKAFVLSGTIAGLAGSLYAHYFTFVSPESFDVHVSIFVLSMVLIGGMGTLWGPVIGAAVLIALPEALRFLPFSSSTLGPLRQIVFGMVLIGFCFARPRGLFVRS
jgi:branched-chain amino acid transport system permease protein